ncbi:hypothetical protein Fmac_009051 [Flemingia macrophylla]|uniref:Chloride conductance regulatory protein ICln n=1 Tax=Flemingia macrophylla TaxID=520843 RepID=A0ABD1MZ45_9FABA
MGVGLREIRCSGEPVLDSENGEELMRVQPGVGIALADRPCESPGTLYITNKQVIWVNDVDRTKGYAIDFLSISLHAISRDPETYPVPCLYTQIDTEEEADEDHSDSESNQSQQNLSNITEMRLIPSDPTQLDTLFETFCRCAELNPEPNGEEEEEHNWIFSADQMVDEEAEDEGYLSHNPANTIGQSNGDHDLARTVLELQINDRRFEDAEEMEDNGDGTHH